MDTKSLVIEHEYDAPIDLVWRAITESELMKKWYFNISEFKAEVGFKFKFEGGDVDKRYTHLCEIVEVIPYKRLKYSWKYEGYTGNSQVTFELSSIAEKTKILLTHKGLNTFVNADFSRDNFDSGWKYLIHESLREFLEMGSSLRYW